MQSCGCFVSESDAVWQNMVPCYKMQDLAIPGLGEPQDLVNTGSVANLDLVI